MRRALPAFVGTAVLGAAALVLAGAGTDGTAGAGGPTGLGAFLADPAAHRGDRVSITGFVDERYGRRAFAVGRPDRPDEVIVVRRGGDPVSGRVRVTGTARTVGEDLRPLLRNDYPVRVGAPVVEADAIERLDDEAPTSGTAGQTGERSRMTAR